MQVSFHLQVMLTSRGNQVIRDLYHHFRALCTVSPRRGTALTQCLELCAIWTYHGLGGLRYDNHFQNLLGIQCINSHRR